MRPHPLFKDWSIPRVDVLGPFTLRMLSVNDVERDFEAVMESAADIRAANPASTWPEGLTEHDNLLDLAWHQREFESRRSFAWIIENSNGEYLGCLYLYPALTGDKSADVRWWWRTGMAVEKAPFREQLSEWLHSAVWPALRYDLQRE